MQKKINPNPFHFIDQLGKTRTEFTYNSIPIISKQKTTIKTLYFTPNITQKGENRHQKTT